MTSRRTPGTTPGIRTVNALKHVMVWCVVAWTLPLSQMTCAARPFGISGRTSGIIAVQEAADGPWRAISPGGILPDVGEIRTSADGPCQILFNTDDGLFFEPLSRIKLDLKTRRVSLISGRMFCRAPKGLTWTVLIGEAQIEITDAGVETAALPSAEIQITVVQGVAIVTVPRSAPVIVKEKTSQTWRANFSIKEKTPVSITPEQESTLAAWTGALPFSQGPGQLVVTDIHGKSPTRLPLVRYRADLVISSPLALVKLDQSFYNPSTEQLQGEYIFNMPPGASVSRFAMFNGETLVDAEILDRRTHQQETRLVGGKQGAAILDDLGDQLFRIRVFPIPTKDVKRVLLEYTVPLECKLGENHFQLPLLSGSDPIWDFRIHGSVRGMNAISSVQSLTHPEVKIQTRSKEEIQFEFVRKNFHPTNDFWLKFQLSEPQDSGTFRRYVAEPMRMSKDPSTPPSPDQFVMPGPDNTLVAGPDHWNNDPATYFLANVPIASSTSEPADVLVLLETSEVMKTVDRLRTPLLTLVHNLRPQDRYRLVCVDVAPRPLHRGWLKAGSAESSAALASFEQQYCIGANDMLSTFDSLETQFQGAEQPVGTKTEAKRRRVAVYLGQGIDSVRRNPAKSDVELTQSCLNKLNQSRVDFWAVNLIPDAVPTIPKLTVQSPFGQGCVIGVGVGIGCFQIKDDLKSTGSSNSTQTRRAGCPILRDLTQALSGSLFQQADKAADRSKFFEWVLSGFPRSCSITDLEIVSTESLVDDSSAADLYWTGSILPGEPLRVTGRIAPTSQLRLRYRIRSSDGLSDLQTVKLSAVTETEDYLVGRFWGEQRLAHLNRLAAFPQLTGNGLQASDAVVRLSQEWSLLTPYTAFLILPDENSFDTWSIIKENRRKYWTMPAEQPIEPLPAKWAVKVAPKTVLKDLQTVSTSRSSVLIESEVQHALKMLPADVRQAITTGELDVASQQLAQLRSLLKQENPEYSQLRLDLQNARKQSDVLRDFGLRRQWFEQSGRTPLPLGLDSLLATGPSIPPSFVKRHPLGEQLLREVDFPGGEITLEDFADMVESQTGVDVVFNRAKLDEEAIAIHQVRKFPALKKVAWFTILSSVLEPHELSFVEHPHQLEITTTNSAAARKRVLFDVQDLMSPQPHFDRRELNDPLMDRYEGAEKQIEAQLQQLVSLELVDATLPDLVDEVKRQLDMNITIAEDEIKNEPIGIDDADINTSQQSVPMSAALANILDPKGLNILIRNEQLIITTKSASANSRTAKVYPGFGLIYRDRLLAAPPNPKPLWNGGALNSSPNLISIGISSVRLSENRKLQVTKSQNSESHEIATDTSDEMAAAASDIDGGFLARLFQVPGTREMAIGNAASHIQSIMQLTGGDDAGAPWKAIDGEGGDIGFFAPGLSFAIRQTREAHQHIEAYFQDLREVKSQQKVQIDQILLAPDDVFPPDAPASPRSLIQLVLQIIGGDETGAPWRLIDGEGGDVSWTQAQMALHVCQTPHALDEVNWLLVKLRRERYAALYGSRPWENHALIGSSSSVLMPPAWSKKSPPAAPVHSKQVADHATQDELELLKIRRPLSSGTWYWTDQRGRRQYPISIRSADADRLQITWPGREILVSGQTVASIAPGLKLAEIGMAGDAVREWLDVEIPFWPHRSNQELAELFDVTLVTAPQPAGTVITGQTLRFVPPAFRNLSTWIDITFDTKTGLPTHWAATSRGQATQQIRLIADASQTELPNSTVLTLQTNLGSGQWVMPVKEAAPIQLPDPMNQPQDFIVLDRRSSAGTREIAGLTQLRRGKPLEAMREIQTALEKTPDQPLLKFLYAVSLDRQGTSVRIEDLRAAFNAAIHSGPPELANIIASQGSLRLSTPDLLPILDQQPQSPRSIQDEFRLAEWMINAGSAESAAAHAAAAIKLNPTLLEERFEITRLLLKARLRQAAFNSALQFFEEWSSRRGQQPLPHVRKLLDEFAAQGVADRVTAHYNKLLQRADVQQLPAEEKRELFLWHAQAMRPDVDLGPIRWASLLAACELLGSPKSLAAQREIQALVAEMRASPATTTDVVAKLVAQSRVEPHRQELQSVLSDKSFNIDEATTIDWKLYQAGFLFRQNLPQVLLRMNQTKQFHRSIAIAEAQIRGGRRLEMGERELIADAYQHIQHPDAAKRIRSMPQVGAATGQ
jgi:hypothetical protein